MPAHSHTVATLLLLALPSFGSAQESAVSPDSASHEVRTVIRAFYRNLAAQNWDALAAYVLSPKLLERRGIAADSELVSRDRTRSRTMASAVQPPASCPSTSSPMIEAAAIRVDGDWADVSVPRCSGADAGVDEFRLIYFEQRWRFIYTDLFSPAPADAPLAASSKSAATAVP